MGELRKEMKCIQHLKRGNIIVTVRITLRKGLDDDLIKIVQNAKPGELSRTIRKMMHEGKGDLKTEEFEEEEVDLSGLGIEI